MPGYSGRGGGLGEGARLEVADRTVVGYTSSERYILNTKPIAIGFDSNMDMRGYTRMNSNGYEVIVGGTLASAKCQTKEEAAKCLKLMSTAIYFLDVEGNQIFGLDTSGTFVSQNVGFVP